MKPEAKFHANDPSGEFKSSKLYESVSEDSWKLYREQKERKTQEMRRSGLYDSTSARPSYKDEFLSTSKVIGSNESNVTGWHTQTNETLPLERSRLIPNSQVTFESIKQRYFAAGLDNSAVFLENSLHGFEHEKIKDDWFLLEADSDGKKVVLENYNLVTSETDAEKLALTKIGDILKENCPDLDRLSNNVLLYGVPNEWRAITWAICLGYLPVAKDKRNQALKSQREAYYQLIQAYLPGDKHYDIEVQHVIHVDVLRTHPAEFSNLFMHSVIQNSLKRILFLWSCQNESVKYFQGLNDICVPFFLTLLNSCFGACSDFNQEYQLNKRINLYLKKFLPSVEADTYWFLTKVMNALKQGVVFSDGGMHAEGMVNSFRHLMVKIDKPLVDRLESFGIDFIMFSFRWMLCFMSRELSIKNTIILWDNYIARGPTGFHHFHLYVCAAFLLNLKPELNKPENDMADCMFILQRPPSIYWEPKNVSQLIVQAEDLWTQYNLI